MHRVYVIFLLENGIRTSLSASGIHFDEDQFMTPSLEEQRKKREQIIIWTDTIRLTNNLLLILFMSARKVNSWIIKLSDPEGVE